LLLKTNLIFFMIYIIITQKLLRQLYQIIQLSLKANKLDFCIIVYCRQKDLDNQLKVDIDLILDLEFCFYI
jgi:hypothetical protein